MAFLLVPLALTIQGPEKTFVREPVRAAPLLFGPKRSETTLPTLEGDAYRWGDWDTLHQLESCANLLLFFAAYQN